MSNKPQKGFNGTPKARTRRTNVVNRLEAQLKSGMKPALKPATGIDVALEEQDIKRINRELETLKKRI
jgi:hypothetical protein